MVKRPKDGEPGAERQGVYSNHFKIGYNAFEFVLDFGQSYEEDKPEARHTRIVTGPAYAKALAKRTLTNLYNERPTWLDLAHKMLDEPVFAAYVWPSDLSDEEILERLLALNLERSKGNKQDG